MSLTASTANIDRPPLLFGPEQEQQAQPSQEPQQTQAHPLQQQPSHELHHPPSTTSNHLHASTQTTPPPMSSAATQSDTPLNTLPHTGQNHDRSAASPPPAQADPGAPVRVANGAPVGPTPPADEHIPNTAGTDGNTQGATETQQRDGQVPADTAMEDAAVETRDGGAPTQSGGSVPAEAGAAQHGIATSNGEAPGGSEAASRNEGPNGVAGDAEPAPQARRGSGQEDNRGEDAPPPPPPPPPQADGVDEAEEDTATTASSDDDDCVPAWQELPEDKSAPDEQELKEIEESGEVSALDHEYWQKKTFTPLEEPEYIPGESGMMHWTVKPFNGTREKPNKELVMKSPTFTVGGHEWQMKFYPRGNESDYLSVYVDCLSVMKKDDVEEPAKSDKSNSADAGNPGPTAESGGSASADGDHTMSDEEPMGSSTPINFLQKQSRQQSQRPPISTPLPLLKGIQPPLQRKSVAAQVSVVLYNPAEPRVNYHKTCLHRFCPDSPDWGWTRFHGPIYEINMRHRGQRQALLRNDTLAFVAHVRIVHDETGCLWEHPTPDNPWDSVAMTGLAALCLADGSGGNVISAIAGWMHCRPFRDLLYNFQVPDPRENPFQRPKPLISALQKVLYLMRSKVQEGHRSPVLVDDITDALHWYGIDDRLEKFDVVRFWERLRAKVDYELVGTPFEGRMRQIFGPPRAHMVGFPEPSYRVPAKGVEDVQDGVRKSKHFLAWDQPMPEVLNVELERSEFDTNLRKFRKLTNKVKLNESIEVHGTKYALLGFMVAKEDLQSNLYYYVVRPKGPGTRFYRYQEVKEDRVISGSVTCLTRKEAMDKHEGWSSAEASNPGNEVAYVVTYLRHDVAKTQFDKNDKEEWETSDWLVNEVNKVKEQFDDESDGEDVTPESSAPSPGGQDVSNAPDGDKTTQNESSAAKADDKARPTTSSKPLLIYDSRIFTQHTGPGFIDVWDPRFSPASNEWVYEVHIPDDAESGDIQKVLAGVVKGGVQDPRQCKFWIMDPLGDALFRPNLVATGGTVRDQLVNSWSIVQAKQQLDDCRMWVHVVPFEDLPQPETPVNTQQPTRRTPPPPADRTGSWDLSPRERARVEQEGAERSAQMDVEIDQPRRDEEQARAPATDAVQTQTGEGQRHQTEHPSTQTDETQPTREGEDTIMSDADEAASPQTDGDGDENMAESESTQPPPPPPPEPQQQPTVEEADMPPPPPPPPMSDPLPPPIPAPTNNQQPILPPMPPIDTEMGGVTDMVNIPPPPALSSGLPPPIPPPTGLVAPPPPLAPTAAPTVAEILVFLKWWDPVEQTLAPIGTYVVPKSDRIDHFAMKKLGVDRESMTLELWEEEDLRGVNPLRRRRNFTQEDLSGYAIVIASKPLSDDDKERLAKQALSKTPAEYLRRKSDRRNFPSMTTGSIVNDYYSAERFEGTVVEGLAHGLGTYIYFSGDAYEGAFRAGRRHGRGRMTFANGDTYDGDWVDDMQQGQGTHTEAATGNTYVGGWRANRRHGEGVTHWRVAQETERMCRICWEEGEEAVFYDCGHVMACLGCARRVDTCPVCRKRVLSAIKLFYGS
ncbi:hypothetical protein BDY21DRAFT_371914 [Lineolata rhizophorae]|uniref:MATH domain-containing protein n=1 Tax=Lineolata rhizophorae TaxID=578093 RepID=A0A6A6NZH7_9PEZI|nr:hypothetical protein BDY21DRAFT_371914 [Lineolata rhizophorae]